MSGFEHNPDTPPAALAQPITGPAWLDDVERVESVRTPISMDYTVTPGTSMSTYLHALADKRIVADLCPETGQVLLPPRGVCATSGRSPAGVVEVADTGFVDSFNVTRLPIKGRDDLKPPYVSAWVVPDGASNGFICLVAGCEPDEVRIGMRVRAVWKPDDELEASAANILWWEPTGEPDHVIDNLRVTGRVDETSAIGGTDDA